MGALMGSSCWHEGEPSRLKAEHLGLPLGEPPPAPAAGQLRGALETFKKNPAVGIGGRGPASLMPLSDDTLAACGHILSRIASRLLIPEQCDHALLACPRKPDGEYRLAGVHATAIRALGK
eukprot:9056979-Pyramimonas_sp.AAC.1